MTRTETTASLKTIFVFLGLGLVMVGVGLAALVLNNNSTPQRVVDNPRANMPVHPIHTDHTNLITGPFETGQEVTAACLACHEDAAHQISLTSHWLWRSAEVEVPWRSEPVSYGKANMLNNFCLGVQSNWTGCTRCHIGYGWKDASYDLNDLSNVDCLVCHDQSRQYVKGPAGIPKPEVDLLLAAQSVGIPTRENCGSCHFNGGGGNAVKHGDLDESMYFPSENIDVHMGRYDFLCTDCHRTTDHNIAGRSMATSPTNDNQVACTDCHTKGLHEDARINAHVDTVACQTCHIPSMALRNATKTVWDWSQAGDETREEDVHSYLRIKGSFVYEAELIPTYTWYNGMSANYLIGDIIDPNTITVLDPPLGSIDDPNALIFPFKLHYGRQPYDKVYNILLQPQLVGKDGYWTTLDWDSALRLGTQAAGMPYSGEYGFADTLMYWPTTHMVQPAERALQCTECHSPNGRMDWQALGYYGDPIVWGGRRR